MLAPVLWVVTRLIAYAARPILALRYRVEIRGLDAIRARGRRGILFLPNHAALIDPAILTAWLYPAFEPRPLADEYQVNRTVLGYVARLYRSRILPNLERRGAEAAAQMRAALADISTGLKQGENILLYPSGRLKRGHLEALGSASGTETIVKAVPEARIVLVRHTGLWGSSFSIAATGKMPEMGSTISHGIKYLLLNGVFFTPKRRVTVEFVEPDDFPRTGTRAEINRYLEAFYNVHAARNTYVPYTFWEAGGTRELPDPRQDEQLADASHVAQGTRDQVLAHLREMSGREDIALTHHLSKDVGLDSLAAAELVAWVQTDFGFSVDTPESLQTVADVVLAAAGQGVSTKAADVKPVPSSWFNAVDKAADLSLPAGGTLTEVFLAQAAHRATQPLFADQVSGVRTYRDLLTAVLVLRPMIAALPGQYVGIMLPASVGATVFLLATLFAGKTAVMVNWTTGPRTVAHSLDLLGVESVVTAKALVAKLGTMGLDLSSLAARFVFVEDLAARPSTFTKVLAALRARLGWTGLERVQPADVAVVLFTSGSENLPKAVPLSHTNILTNVRDIMHMGRLAESDIILGMLPPFHSFGLTATVFMPMTIGLRTVFHANPTESSVLARLTGAYRATVIFGTPTFLTGITRVAEQAQLASLRLAVTGAEKCPDALYATLRERWPAIILLEGYGITECSPVVAVNPMDAPVPGSIGCLLPSVDGVVTDLELKDRVEPGETGMLLVHGPSVFSGYLNYTGESPFVHFEDKDWYRTGDLVSMTPEGILYFKGRLKRFVKLGGEMISLPAIEAVLHGHLGEPTDGPVFAVESLGAGENLEIVLFTTRHADRAAVNAVIKEAGLSALHFIRRVIDVKAIPVLGTGKTDYRALKATYGGSAA